MAGSLPAVRLHSREVLLDDRTDGVSVSIFHSYCETYGRRWCATRRVRNGDWLGSSVELDGQHLDYGEDPRIFVHDGRPAIVAVTHVSGYGLRNHLYEFRHGNFDRSHLLVPDGLPPGKNWSPFTAADGTVGFVHSFDPPTILREKRREHGVVVLEIHTAERVATEMGPGGFPAFRGGTNGVWVDGFTVGIGHTTRYRPGQTGPTTAELGFDHLRHRPFGWVLSRDTRRLRLFDIEGDFPAEFDVVDPTSLIMKSNGEFELFTTEVHRHFHDPTGRRQVACYRFRLDDAFRDAARHTLEWEELRPERFLSNVAVVSDDTWRCRLAGVVGHVVTGPYVMLPAGRYEACFDVSWSESAGAHGLIELDVAAGSLHLLAKRSIADSDLHQDACTLEFAHHGPQHPLEFRVGVSGFETGELRFGGVRYRCLSESSEQTSAASSAKMDFTLIGSQLNDSYDSDGPDLLHDSGSRAFASWSNEMSTEITEEDRAKLKLLLSLVNEHSQPNLNALLDVLRNITALHLNIKTLGYELAQRMRAALPVPTQTTARFVGLKSKPSVQIDVESDWVAHWCGQLKIPVIYHRKIWELAYVLQAMHENNHIRAGSRGLGFGCGVEAIPSYLASHGVTVTVTDLPPEDSLTKGWANTNQHTTSLEQSYHPQLVSRQQFEDNISLRYVDMNLIPDDLTGYDFCWSVCALEHVGSIEKGLAFIENSLKTLRPGGMAVHTTELNIRNSGPTIDNWGTVLFQQKHFEQLEERLRSRGHTIAELDFDLGNGFLDRFIDLPPWPHDMPGEFTTWLSPIAHLKVATDGFLTTCFGIIVRKAE